MTKQFLYTDESGIRSNIEYVETAIRIINPLFEKYKTLGLQEIKAENLKEFLDSPKAFFVKILSQGESLKVGQMELEPAKIYELFPVPVEIKSLVDEIESFIRESNFMSSYAYPLQYIDVVENELIVLESYRTSITEKFTYYTETEEQNQALELLQKITADLNTLKGLGKKPFFYYKKLMESCFKEKDTNAGNVIYENIMVVRDF